MSFAMEIKPHQIIRLLQLGQTEKALSSKTIWYCAGCQTCYSRCPQKVDLPKIMDALCQEADEQNLIHKDVRQIEQFHRSFIGSLKRSGLSNEVLLVAEYKLRSRKFFSDVALAPVMFCKGKLKLLPRRVKNMNVIRKIFKRGKV